MTLPIITGVNPTIGSIAGGSVITIWGHHFKNIKHVYFGVTQAISFTINSHNQITAICPPIMEPAVVDLTIANKHGASNAIKFTYIDKPIINNIIVNDSLVTINGSNFTSTFKVLFGEQDALYFKVTSDTLIEAIAPSFTLPSNIDIIITNLAGDSLPFPFTFSVPPLITSINPSRGSSLGGDLITIYGQGFTNVINVSFGGTDIAPLIISDTQLTVTSPPGLSTVYVYVNTATEQSNSVTFTYVASPTISSISPNSGPTAGHNYVTITGTELTWATSVNFGAQSSTQISIISDSLLTVSVPPGSAGVVNVSVVTPGGTSNTLPYTYVDPPII